MGLNMQPFKVFVEEFGILGFRVLGSWFGNVG